MAIGKLEPVPLRELWRREEQGFSAWLAEKPAELSRAIGITLTEPQRERKAGTFEVDVVAEDENSNLVIIENQLEPSDHDHLGKLLTYMTNLDAKCAVWITAGARPEHIRAIQWLNETTPQDVSFFLVRLSAHKIGKSDAAPLFSVIVGPSAESKDVGKKKKDLAERHILRRKFWEKLLARAKERGVLIHASRSGTMDSWIWGGAGKSGLGFVYTIWMDEESAVELYIDAGEKEENKQIFDRLLSQRSEIEKAFGAPLLWERLDDKRACRIRHIIKLGGISAGEEKWPAIQEAMITEMDQLSKALKPMIAKL